MAYGGADFNKCSYGLDERLGINNLCMSPDLFGVVLCNMSVSLLHNCFHESVSNQLWYLPVIKLVAALTFIFSAHSLDANH